MTHRGAVAAMVAATLMWSIAGVVSRQLDAARAFEVTFWRSAFNALALVLLLPLLRGGGARGLARSIAGGGPALWVSGLCWAVMFTAFMVALTMTPVANVLVTMALGPLLTALLARLWLGHRLPLRTWAAVALAGVGIGWMYGHALGAGVDGTQAWGLLVALGVPMAAAVNWTLLQRLRPPAAVAAVAVAVGTGAAPVPAARGDGPAVPVVAVDRTPPRAAPGDAPAPPARAGDRPAPAPAPAPRDMLPAVLIGAVLSAVATLPLAWPFAASARDLAWLALLGVVQLALPCLIAVAAARVLAGPELSLLALLEVVFGVAWVWLGAGEAPSHAVLGGGALVLAALVGNEALALRGAHRRPAGLVPEGAASAATRPAAPPR